MFHFSEVTFLTNPQSQACFYSTNIPPSGFLPAAMGDTDEHHHPHEHPPKPTQMLPKPQDAGHRNPGGKLPLIPISRIPVGWTQGPPSPGHHFSSTHSQHPFLLEKRRKEKPVDCSLRNIFLVANGIHSPGYHDISRHTQAPSNSQKNSFQWVQNVAYTPRSVFIGQVSRDLLPFSPSS